MERTGCKGMDGGRGERERKKVRNLPLFRIQTSEVNNVILNFHSGAFGFFVRDSVQRLGKRMTLAGESAVAVIMVMPPGTEPSTHWLHVYTARCYIGVEEGKKNLFYYRFRHQVGICLKEVNSSTMTHKVEINGNE